MLRQIELCWPSGTWLRKAGRNKSYILDLVVTQILNAKQSCKEINLQETFPVDIKIKSISNFKRSRLSGSQDHPFTTRTFPLHSMPLSGIVIIIGILLGITTLIGILGNISVCLVVFWNRSMRNQLHLFLVNLAIADVGMSASCMPFAVATVLFHEKVCLTNLTRLVTVKFMDNSKCMPDNFRRKITNLPEITIHLSCITFWFKW